MITITIFWALVLVLFQTSDDSTRERQVGNQRRVERR